MRKPIWLGGGLLIAVGIVTVGALTWRSGEPTPQPPSPQDIAALSPVQTVRVVAPADDPVSSASTPPSSPPPDTSTPAAPAAPAAEPLAQLPVEDVEPRTVHAVPDGETLNVPHVTLQDRQGHPLARPRASAPPPPTYVPSIGPGSQQASAAPPPSYRPSVPPAGAAAAPPPSYRPSVPPGGAAAAPPPSYRPSVPSGGAAAPIAQVAALPTSLSGPANATGTVSLAISGHSVRLYGVLPPASTDRCALGTGAPQTCGDVTEAMLAARLARSPTVTCRLPPGSSAADPARICVDATGADIAGYLVGEGLAVADRHAGGGYAGAETVARSSGKGLWRFR
jgi:endonuclease YncB( thermonuclease family)